MSFLESYTQDELEFEYLWPLKIVGSNVFIIFSINWNNLKLFLSYSLLLIYSSGTIPFKCEKSAIIVFGDFEPMINAGRPDVVWLDDDWTVVTSDNSLSAHYENTIVITEGEPEILTVLK